MSTFTTEAIDYRRLLLEAIDGHRTARRVYLGRGGMEYETHFVAGRTERDGRTSGTCALTDCADEMLRLHPSLGQPELGAWQLELASAPEPLTGNVFSQMEVALNAWSDQLLTAGQQFGVQPLFAPIAPTLTAADMSPERLSKNDRQQRLERGWQRALEAYRQRHGYAPSLLGFTPRSINVSSAMASAQFHIELPTDPEEAAVWWNAALAATGPTLAASTGAPWLLNGRGEQFELRIPIWEELDDLARGRVFFGPGWVRDIYQVLAVYADLPRLTLDSTEVDEELSPHERLVRHVRSVWPHVRLIPEVDCLHIEQRAIGTAPPLDTAATSAFYFGLVRGLVDEYGASLPEQMAFRDARDNFYGAARNGLNSHFQWLGGRWMNSGELILADLMPLAERGLRSAQIDAADIQHYLGIVYRRVALKRTLAHWLKRTREICNGDMLQVTLRMLANQQSRVRLPIHEWPEWR